MTKQDRTSPYFFEHKIELKWEKGGSGLVFYTDEVFWKEHEGKDFENLDMADDIDIDMRMYHESAGNIFREKFKEVFINRIGSADRDGNELQSLRHEEDLREGRIVNQTNPEHRRVGVFEKHTKVDLIVFFRWFSFVFRTIPGYWTTFVRTSWMARWSRSWFICRRYG